MLSSLFARFSLYLFASSLALPGLAAAENIRVLTSIKPLALIAQEVVGEHGDVSVLLPIAASPHDYPLKVSDIRLLRQADLFVWVGPELEAFLQRPLNNLAAQKQLSVYHLPGLRWPEGETVKHSGGAHHHNDDHHHHNEDPHLWLDPHNAVVIAQALARELGERRPAAAEVYLANAERFASQTEALDRRIAEKLMTIRDRGFAVYHEGYLHFVQHYQLRQLGFVTYAPERRPGARHLHQLHQTLKGEASCLFVEPYYDPRSARELGESLGLRIGVLDPIGGEHIKTYGELMEGMAQDFLACLTQA